VHKDADVKLLKYPTDFNGKKVDKEEAHSKTDDQLAHISALQELLYAQRKQSLLIVLQAMDAGGKDGTVKVIGHGMNPAGCKVVSFKEPNAEELAHDFLWRVSNQTPRKGEIVVFNRSHYEDVLVVRVHKLAPTDVWKERFEMINDFERRLVANGTHIIKFFLHISPEEQLSRLWARVEDPSKNWKLSPSDFQEREKWDQYQGAYEDVLSKCSSKHAPWFIIPADHKWYRDYCITKIIEETLEGMKISMPQPVVNIKELLAKYGPMSPDDRNKPGRNDSHRVERRREDSQIMYAPIAQADADTGAGKGASREKQATDEQKTSESLQFPANKA